MRGCFAQGPCVILFVFVSFSKEHLRVLSQHVHEREVYLQPSRMGHLDVLAMHGQVEKYAKTKTSLRQQPTGGPKIMFV